MARARRLMGGVRTGYENGDVDLVERAVRPSRRILSREQIAAVLADEKPELAAEFLAKGSGEHRAAAGEALGMACVPKIVEGPEI